MYLLTGDPDTCTAILLAMEHEEGSEETPGMDRDVGHSTDPALHDATLRDCTHSVSHGLNLTSGTVSCCAKHLCERLLLAVQIRALLMRAQSEKRSLADQAAVRHRRSEFPVVQHRVGDVIEHRRCASCTR
jgi:hypothetical protein